MAEVTKTFLSERNIKAKLRQASWRGQQRPRGRNDHKEAVVAKGPASGAK